MRSIKPIGDLFGDKIRFKSYCTSISRIINYFFPKVQLLIYIASRMKWDRLKEGQYLLISKNCLLKNLDLLGSNKSRNNKILWRTIEQLNEDKIIIRADQYTVLTVDDAIKMNSCHKIESDLMIVNLHEDARIAELIRAETITSKHTQKDF